MGNRRSLTAEDARVMRAIGDGKKLVELCGEMPKADNVEVARVINRLVEEGRLDRFKIDRYESPTYALSELGESALDDYQDDKEGGLNKMGSGKKPLDPEKVARIRELSRLGRTNKQIAREMRLSKSCVYRYAKGVSVKRFDEPERTVTAGPGEVICSYRAEPLKNEDGTPMKVKDLEAQKAEEIPAPSIMDLAELSAALEKAKRWLAGRVSISAKGWLSVKDVLLGEDAYTAICGECDKTIRETLLNGGKIRGTRDRRGVLKR